MVLFSSRASADIRERLRTLDDSNYDHVFDELWQVIEANAELIRSNKLSKESNIFHKAAMQGSLKRSSVKLSDLSSSGGTNIEAEANSYYEQLFNGQMSIDEMVKMLACYKESSERREILLFDRMVKTIVEEYQFFPKYPDTQLNIAAALVGSLIRHRLLDLSSLGTFLCAVLDALRKPSNSKIFNFGVMALSQFLERLVEWPVYCNHLLQICHLRGFPWFVALVEDALVRVSSGHPKSDGGYSVSVNQKGGYALSSSENIERQKGSFADRDKALTSNSVVYFKQLLPSSVIPSNVPVIKVPASQKTSFPRSSQTALITPASIFSSQSLHSSQIIASTSVLTKNLKTTGFGTALNSETLAAAERMAIPVEAPPSDVQDKILFMINNISISNIEAKVKAFCEILNEQYYPWFAQYMVMRRASIEPKFHDVYLKFLDKLGSKSLNKEIVKASYCNCKVLLRSELIKSSSEERSLLKNLGRWLGKFTIGRNQGLRAREIDPKSLIIKAYEDGLMIAVIPFTSKILASCQTSLAFRPPNPWTMAILGLLLEIYRLPNLKMNMKFEIEVLFKTICVDMKKVQPTSLLKGRYREVEGNPDFNNKAQHQTVVENNSEILSTASQGVIAQIPEILQKYRTCEEAALAFARKVFKSLYENPLDRVHVASHLAILASIRDVCNQVVKELTIWVIYLDEERKFNVDIIVGFICKGLLNLAKYNMHMAKLIDAGRNKVAAEFAVSLLKTLLTQDSGASVLELPHLVDALAKLATLPESPDSLQLLINTAKIPNINASGLSGIVSGKVEKAKQSREKGFHLSSKSREGFINVEVGRADDSSFRQKVLKLFEEWLDTYEGYSTSHAACTRFILQLQQSGYLKGDSHSDRFFCLLTELCVSTKGLSSGSYSLPSHQASQTSSSHSIDIYAKLVHSILKYCMVEHGQITLFPKILSVTVGTIQKDAVEKRGSFNPRPYLRLFSNWIFDLLPDPILHSACAQMLLAFANSFHMLQPVNVPGFSFAWLELVSHRSFMPKLLKESPQNFQRLLVDLFRFMEPYLRNIELGLEEPIQFLYEGSLRVLLVLLHDFPEFLCAYHFSFCDVIPSNCIQMRNVILSAFPLHTRNPDLSTPNLKIDFLAESKQSPQILSEVDAALKAKQIKSDVDEFLKTRHQGLFFSELRQKLLLTQFEASKAGTWYNIPLINSLVLYIGMQTIQQIQTKAQSLLAQQRAHVSMEYLTGAAMDIFHKLITDFEKEGRYLFINAITNQLRFPNDHTQFFSYILLRLFAETNQDIVHEQIARVLVERLAFHIPLPWGLVVTFTELIQNPKYNFWNRPFAKRSPEVEKILKLVATRCLAAPHWYDYGGIPYSMQPCTELYGG